MAYAVPYVDSTGLHISSYTDILNDLISGMKSIYGSDIYLGSDSQDYQMISAFALKAYDVQQSLLLAYNNANPVTAIGAGLDRVVTFNGIKRKSPTYSTCAVLISGTANTVITNGVAKDINGYLWDLPTSVTIPLTGSAYVTATCETIGHIQAAIGSINVINTPTSGWISVVNDTTAATPGSIVEQDSELRSRQVLSTSITSKTIFNSTIAAVSGLAGVTRTAGYENDSSATVNGLPPKSITVVAEGGDATAIANEIYSRKTPGCYTNGDQVINIVDEYGQTTPIRFYRPTYVQITCTINITKLTPYSDAIGTNIKQNAFNYLSALKIGNAIYVRNIVPSILLALTNTLNPEFYVTGVKVTKATVDYTDILAMGNLEVASLALTGITLVVV